MTYLDLKNIFNISLYIKEWLIIFIISLLFFFDFGLHVIFNTLGHDIQNFYQLTTTQLGFLSSVVFWSNVIFLIPAGIIIDIYKLSFIIMCAIILSTMSVLFISISHNIFIVIISEIAIGASGAFSFLSCIKMATQLFPPKYMALVTGFIVTMGMIGGFFAQEPIVILIQHFGWRGALLIVFIVGCLITILMWIAFCTLNRKIIVKTNIVSAANIINSLKKILVNVQNWLCTLYTCTMNLPIYVLGALWGVPYLIKTHDFSNEQASKIIGMLFIGSMVGGPIAGWLSDKMQRRKLVMLLGAFLSLTLILFIIHMQIASVQIFMLLFFILGFTVMFQVISYPTLCENNAKESVGSGTSLISMLTLMGGAIAQPVFGRLLIIKSTNSVGNNIHAPNYSLAINLLLISFIISLISAFFIKETYCKRLVINDYATTLTN
jgi:MFS family permease